MLAVNSMFNHDFDRSILMLAFDTMFNLVLTVDFMLNLDADS